MKEDIKDINQYIKPFNNNLYLSMTNTNDQINGLISYLGLPTENIVQDLPERRKSFRNLEDVINEITSDKKSMSYLSKFVYSTSMGLFDASLNYLWDATINELRKRIIDFDVEYFYDVSIGNTEKRNDFKSKKDLKKINDAQLLLGIKKMEMISDTEFHQLDHIRYMRNYSSTAHPNDKQLTGINLIDWLETCIKIVFNLPLSELNLEIKKLLSDVKQNHFTNDEISAKKGLFNKLTKTQCTSLLNGLFGIYISPKSGTSTITNIKSLAPALWSLCDDDVKTKIGTNYGNFKINSHREKSEMARKFLKTVKGESYIPEDLQVSEISNIISDLNNANDSGMNNFYTEPYIAKDLYDFIGAKSSLPKKIEDDYILCLTNVYMTNGYGIAWSAETLYDKMIEKLNDNQAFKVLMSFNNPHILYKLSFPLCSKQFKKLITKIKEHFNDGKANDLADFIINFQGKPLCKFVNDSKYKKTFEDYVNNYKNNI